MRPVYGISGLGADERVFSRLTLRAALKPVKWIQPLKDEVLRDYALRLKEQIVEPDPVLVGLSFGGMMAIELAKLMPVSQLVLVSSVKSRSELPVWMRGCGIIRAHNVLPSKPLQSIKGFKLLRPIQNYFLGVESEDERAIANEYRDHVDPVYLKWAIGQVLTWQNVELPVNVLHIHGTNDHIFPFKNIRGSIPIKSGGHFMIMNRAAEVSEAINRFL